MGHVKTAYRNRCVPVLPYLFFTVVVSLGRLVRRKCRTPRGSKARAHELLCDSPCTPQPSLTKVRATSDGFSSFCARSAAVSGCTSRVAVARTKSFASKCESAWPMVASSSLVASPYCAGAAVAPVTSAGKPSDTQEHEVEGDGLSLQKRRARRRWPSRLRRARRRS